MADPEEKDTSAPPAEDAVEEEAEKGVQAAVTREGACECTILIQAEAEHLKKQYEEKLSKFKKDAQVSGFRQGKAPVSLLERRFGDKIKADVLAAVAGEAYEEAVEENDLTVVAELESPDFEEYEWEVGEPAEFEFKCEVMPELDLDEGQYKGLAVEAPRLEMTDEMLQQEMDRFAQQLASWEKVEEGGIDWEDYVEAEVGLIRQEQEGEGWSQDVGFYPRAEKIGPFSVEGIKAAVMGAKAGDTLEVDAEVLPAEEIGDESLQSLAGQPVKISIRVKAVYRKNVPEIDDELAKKLNMDSVEEMRSMVKERLERSIESRKVEATRQSAVAALLERIPVEMPASLVSKATVDEQRRLLTRALRAGIPRDQAEELMQSNADRSREAAVRSLKASFVLRKIADKERIFVLDSEVQQQVNELGARQGWSARKSEKYMEEHDLMQSLRWDMREDKAVEAIVAQAEVSEIDPDEFARRAQQQQQSEEQEE